MFCSLSQIILSRLLSNSPMAESTRSSLNSPPPNPSANATPSHRSWPLGLLLSAVAAVAAALVLVQLDTFEAAAYPANELTQKPMPVIPRVNNRLLHGSEKIASGQVMGPEDIVFDPMSGVVYTSCVDGWIKRIRVNDSVVENWVNTGGRPLGLAVGFSGEVFVADAYKGLLKVTQDGDIEVLTNEAEGLKFNVTDAVVVAKNDILYFTDASSKYDLENCVYDILEGLPHGRLMSYDLSTKETKVLARDLYFANGVEISPDQDFVIFCETPMRRCMRYYIQGQKRGSIDVFVDNLPGMPDNIHYDGQGRYWIAIPTEYSYAWKLTQRYPYIRKVFAFLEKYHKRPWIEKNAGVVVVDLEGRLVERYYDTGLVYITTGTKMAEYLYLGNLFEDHIIRLNITRYPAITTSQTI